MTTVTCWGQEEDRRRSDDARLDHHEVRLLDPQAVMKVLEGLSDAERK
jgi:hypothetical protein